MKLDLDFIKEILGAIEGHERSQIQISELLRAIEVDLNDDAQMDKFYGHIKIIGPSGFIECDTKNFGFLQVLSGPPSPATNAMYGLTLSGHQMLDVLRNTTLMGKVKAYLNDVGVSGLKSAPGFIIGLAFKYLSENGG